MAREYTLNYTTYQLPDFNNTNVSSMGEIFVWANQTVSYGFGVGVVATFFGILFMITLYKSGSARIAFGTSSIIAAIIAVIFRGIDLLSDFVVGWFIIAAVFGIAWLYVGED